MYDDVSVEPWDVADLDKDCFGGRYVSETTNKASLHPPPPHPAKRASSEAGTPSQAAGSSQPRDASGNIRLTGQRLP